MPVNTTSQDLGTVFSQGLSVVTTGNSAVSAYGPVIGRDVAVIALVVPIAGNSGSTETSFAVTGAAVQDGVIVHPPSAVSANIVWSGFVSSAGNVTLRWANPSTTTQNQTAQTWGVSLVRRSFVTRNV